MRLLELGAVACRLPIGYRVLLALFQWIVAEMRWLAYKLKAYRDTPHMFNEYAVEYFFCQTPLALLFFALRQMNNYALA